MKDWQWMILVIVLFIGFVVGLFAFIDFVDRRDCNALSRDTGLPTTLRHGACYIEVCNDLWVLDTDVVYNLGVVRDCAAPGAEE